MTEPDHHQPTSIWQHILQQLDPSLKLENKASVARDHLANERTFLAWIRTSLSLITVGVAISQLYRLSDNEQPVTGMHSPYVGKLMGSTFVMMGILYVILACWRYFHTQHAMTQGMFPANRLPVLIGALLVLLVLSVLFALILIERPL
jgi:uncharacterized membrane protein YidH (DUF202 family)